MMRLSERLPRPQPLPLRRPCIESILLGNSNSGRMRWVDNGLTSMMELTGATMAMFEIKFDEGERALIQGRADAAGMSFPSS